MAPRSRSRSRRSRTDTQTDTRTDTDPAYDYHYQQYYTQDENSTTSGSSSSSSASQEEQQEEEQAYYSDSSEETATESSTGDHENSDNENQQAAYDYEYVYTTDSDSASESERGEPEASESDDTDSSNSQELEEYSQVDDSTDNDDDNDYSSDSNSNSNTFPVRNVPSGTETSQCTFQASPKWLSSSELDALKGDADQYIDYQANLVSRGGSDVESMMNGLYYYCDSHGVSGGNWLAFVSRNEASTAWYAVREANEEGRLGGYAELRTRDDKDDCVIAVYVSDYSDVDNCADIYHEFNHILASTTSGTRISAFKLALLSTLGIYRHSNDNSRYTFEELGMKKMPTPDGILGILGKKQGGRNEGRTDNNNGGRGKRGGRRKNKKRRNRGRGGGGEGYYPKYTNRYYHGRRSSRTLPNGYWTPTDKSEGWVIHRGHEQVEGRGNHRSSTGEEKGCAILDAHRYRLHSEGYVSASERRAVMRQLWDTADRYDIVIGKWCVYVPAKVADSVWKRLCEANDNGELGGCIKLSPYNESTDKFMMVVYCNDFTNLHDCQRILYSVHNIVGKYGIDVIANFKPDFFSRIGVYRNRLHGTHVEYPLNELGLAKFWPHPELKRMLDQLKGR